MINWNDPVSSPWVKALLSFITVVIVVFALYMMFKEGQRTARYDIWARAHDAVNSNPFARDERTGNCFMLSGPYSLTWVPCSDSVMQLIDQNKER